MIDPFKPADLWEQLVRRGVSKAEATRHVLLRVANSPEKIQAEYLKDVDPGKLASFGLGAADMASFGLGDQAARALWGKEATDTQQAAEQLHPTAHLAGEIAGIISPLAIERGLAAAGVKLAPTAIGAAVRSINSLPVRALAQTGLNAATGAGYASAQAAGRTEGGLAPRLAAAKQAAGPGAIAGAILPLGAATIGAAGSKVLGPILKRIAGAGPSVAAAAPEVVPGLLTAAGTPEELAVAKQLGLSLDQVRGRVGTQAVQAARSAPPISQEPLLPALRGMPDPLDAPAFARNARPAEPPASGLLPYYPRGGAAEQALPPSPVQSAPVIGPASPEIIVRSSSYADLMHALEQPALTARARQAILGELQRRGIVGSGLLAPAVQGGYR